MPLSSAKRAQRLRLLTKSLVETAELFNKRIETDHGVPNAIGVTGDPARLEAVIDAYSLEVDRFKRAHGFSEGERINNGKIAGLMTRILVRDGVDGLFIVTDPHLRDAGLDVAAGTFFVWHLASSIVALDRGAMSASLRDDFLGAISRCDDASPELLCLAMAALREAFGDRETVCLD